MKPMTHNLLRREWLQYKSFGRTWLWIWVLYLGMYLLLGVAAGFVVVFLPIIMAYSAIYSAKQTGEAVNAGTEDFLLPVPLRDVLWAKYLFAFLMGSASAVVVLAAVLFQTLLNPEEAINPFYVLGVTMTYTAVITGVGMPLLYRVRRHQGTPHPAGAHGNFSRSGRQYGSGGPGCSGRRARWSRLCPDNHRCGALGADALLPAAHRTLLPPGRCGS